MDALERKTGHRRGKWTKQVKQDARHPHKRKSRTDPDAGYLNRPSKPHGMHYLSHQTVDTGHGVILDVAVTSGDTSDVTPYLAQWVYLAEKADCRSCLPREQCTS